MSQNDINDTVYYTITYSVILSLFEVPTKNVILKCITMNVTVYTIDEVLPKPPLCIFFNLKKFNKHPIWLIYTLNNNNNKNKTEN